ncbi:DNA polymerase III subunit alpha [Mycoplasma sp. 4044]
MKLINLHTNTTFSFLESTIELDKLLQWAQENELDTVAVTEHNNMLSYASFCTKAHKLGINTIYGIDLDVTVESTVYRFILLAKNFLGLQELFAINFDFFKNHKVGLEQILKAKNIIIIDHPTKGFFVSNNSVLLKKENFYTGLTADLAEKIDIDFDKNNFLLVNENRCFDSFESKTLSTLNWIKTQEHENKLATGIYTSFENPSPRMAQLIEKTNNLAKQLVVKIEHSKFKMPVYPNPDNVSSTEYLKKIILENIDWKLKGKQSLYNTYKARIKYELDVIESLGYCDYFLIIWDFIKWAKENNISTGPGRGSAAGSLISYLMDITQMDPIEYGLLFERFLNPKRISLPDIDIDVQDDKRQELIDYLIRKYGTENVATIVTFSTLGVKSSMRDVARSYSVPIPQIDSLARKIPSTANTLQEAYDESFSFRTELNKYINNQTGNNDLMEAYEEACQIQGFYRQSGTHAAGIVISQDKVVNKIPVMLDSQDHLQTQLSMDYLEDFGLLKIDILGLRTLTIINEILMQVWKINPDFDINKIDVNDKETFQLLSEARTAGIFQLESPGMRSTLLKVKVDHFNDIAAIISLFRPGTAQYIDLYAKRKNGLEIIKKKDPVYDEIMASTYGIMIYQEQILQLVQKISNMDYAEADLLRRAISKKKIEEFEEFKAIFVEKSVQNGYSEQFALDIFKDIEKFAGYGFNKSHAVSYSLISYRMAYLKAHFPLEFYSAIISSSINSLEDMNKYCLEAQDLGIRIYSPSLNHSSNISVIDREKNAIYLPFAMIKGLGKVTERDIILKRQERGEFKNLLEAILCLREAGIGEEKIKLLVKAGVFRDFGNQTMILNNLENSSELKFEIANAFDARNKKVFWDKIDWNINLLHYKQDIDQEMINEITYLGRTYNVSPTIGYENKNCKIIDIHRGTQHVVAAYVKDAVVKITKTNKPYTHVVLLDSSATIDVRIWKESDIVNAKNKVIYATLTKKMNGDWVLGKWEEKHREE